MILLRLMGTPNYSSHSPSVCMAEGTDNKLQRKHIIGKGEVFGEGSSISSTTRERLYMNLLFNGEITLVVFLCKY